MNKLNKILCFLLILVFMLTGLPPEVRLFAAPDDLNLSVVYNPLVNKYEISYPINVEPEKTVVQFHNSDKSLTEIEYVKGGTNAQIYANGRVTVRADFQSDHIYDLSVRAEQTVGGSRSGEVYFLANMTFTGESFNQMAELSLIEDKAPDLGGLPEGSAVVVKSGDEPVIKLGWKIPTIYSEGGGDGAILRLTDREALDLLRISSTGPYIDKACFQINMTVGQNPNDTLVFNIGYDQDGNMFIKGTAVKVTAGSDDMVFVELTQNERIQPGAEYAINISVVFEDNSPEPKQIALVSTKLSAARGNSFQVSNRDNIFIKTHGEELTSVYTPMQMELSKVDTDKVEVRFKRIVNESRYPELYYQVQYAPRIDNFFDAQTNKWVKIPASSLPSTEAYGSEIVTINITGDTNPEYYFRVVYYDSSSIYARSSSLAVNINVLGVDSGKPPLPKEIKAEPIYVGREKVTLQATDLSAGVEKEVEIPASDLRLSFEKPLAWRKYTGSGWEAFRTEALEDSDFIFHIILSTYLPESGKDKDTATIGLDNPQEIYLPTKQKRVLVLSKEQFEEDPANPNRIICTIDGTKLFYDYVEGDYISRENNEDVDGYAGSTGDYPTFLVPNTTYFMQVFTSKKVDNEAIYTDLWADGLGTELNNKLSYMSPIVSFTTWPLTETPVPMPDIQLSIDPETNVDPVMGEIKLEGIRVSYPRLLTDEEWKRYTELEDDRVIQYEIFLSRDASSFEQDPIVIDSAVYPGASLETQRMITIPKEDSTGKRIIFPNTVYYIKARAVLEVDGIVIGHSVDTAVKAITTPKIDDGGLEDIERDPRAPSEFSIAVDENGALLLTDAWVTLNWLHAEEDVTYEMVVTSKALSPEAKEKEDEYRDDPVNQGFLQVYNDLRTPPNDNKLHLDVKRQDLPIPEFSLSENGHVIMPIRREFLRPNRIYFFSLRAVRERGNAKETTSRWITIPVTTRMVQAPAFIEAVKDLEIGFNIQNTAVGVTPDDMEVYLKKSESGSASYVLLNRAEYTCVQDGTTFYFRMYNLETNQWYDVFVKNKANNTWYDARTKTWTTNQGTPVKEKTRDALREIEVRWEGEEPYKYFLEARAENEAEYLQLEYRSTGHTDYGYDLPGGGRIDFYREKTRLYVEGNSAKYIYYAKISGKPVRDENGVLLTRQSLKSNTLYYVKLWAYNREESLHIGPATARTDFSQDDYDEQKKEDNTIDLFEESAGKLTQKLYWRIDIRDNATVRVLLKDDRIEGLLKVAGGSTVTVDISSEGKDTSYYEVLIPYKTLEAIDKYNSPLNIKVLGAEFTLNKGSIDLALLKSQTLTGVSKEPMVLLKINRRKNPKSALTGGFSAFSDAYELQVAGIGSRRSYAEIDHMLHEILKNPEAKGPFRYGILDRELTGILNTLAQYSYKSHTDLRDLINSVIGKVEVELSRYLKDIIDGGSGLASNIAVTKGISQFPDKMGIKLEYRYHNGFITPFVNYGAGFKEPSGSKGYVMQYALFRVEGPGEYVVVGKGQIVTPPGTVDNSSLSLLSSKYDLTRVFGQGTIYPASPIKGEEAVTLYAVVTNRDSQITGMTPVQKASTLGLGDIIGRSQLTGYMDNQSSVSMAVKLYGAKANINIAQMKPSKTIAIQNGSEINPRLYSYVVLGVDLDITRLNNNRFDANGRTTIGTMLDMVARVLEMLN